MRTANKPISFAKYAYFFLILGVLFSSSSCKKDEKVVDNLWKDKNEAALKELSFSSEYTPVVDPAGNGTLYIKWLKRGEGKRVYYTSLVDVYYKGMLIDKTQFDKLDKEDGEPFKVAVSQGVSTPEYSAGVIAGWSLSLQYMTEGDKCEVWIPQSLAYGSSDRIGSSGGVSIPGYSTLIFEIDVVGVKQ